MLRITRRRFVIRGGAAAGALSAVSVAGLGGIERALAVVSGSLSPARRATYGALVEAVALAGTTDVSATNIRRTTDEFEAICRVRGPKFRRSVENVLDCLREGAGGAGFAKASAPKRLQYLRDWFEGPIEAEHRGLRWRAVAPTAVTYAALPFYPHGPDDPPFPTTV
jgi:hypothetical protein